MKIEVGAFKWMVAFKGGELQRGSPRIDILQDNLKEVAAQIPDGEYSWVLVMDLDKAEKKELPD